MNRFRALIIPAVASVGAAFCIVNLTGGHLLCGSGGCEIYASYRILGLPFYFWGALLFLVLAVVAGPRATPQASPWPLYPLVATALAIDTALLAYQSLLWPCLGCLFIAALLGVIAALCLWLYPYFRTRIFAGVMAAWVLLFFHLGITVGKQTLLRPWAIAGAADAPIQVFFSPTCEACQEAAFQILNSPDVDQAAFFPVAKSQEDFRRIRVVAGQELSGEAAVRRLFEGTDKEGKGEFGLDLRLLRNKMALASLGLTRVPAVITSILPRQQVFQMGGFTLPWPSEMETADTLGGCEVVSTGEACD